MATFTSFLNLRKPSTSDTVNVTLDLSDNFEAIDDAIASLDARLDAVEGFWTTFTPVLTTVGGGTPSVGTGGNATLTGSYKKIGNTVHAKYFMRWGTAGTDPGSGSIRLSLPINHAALPASFGVTSPSIEGNGHTENEGIAGFHLFPRLGDAVDKIAFNWIDAAGGFASPFNFGAPFAWGAGDWMTAHITYEAA